MRVLRVEGTEKRRFAAASTELRIPGVRVRERLRLPTELAQRTDGLGLEANEIDVVLERTSADFPYRAGADRDSRRRASKPRWSTRNRASSGSCPLPAARAFAVSGWASVAPDAPDDALDRLAGMPAGWRFTSSSRFEGVPGRRASSAFDGDPATAWAGDVARGRGAWIALRTARPVRVDRFRLTRGPAAYAFPARVRVSVPGRAPVVARVAAGGEVSLPAPVRTRALRIEVLAVTPASGGAAHRRLRAVAIGDVELKGLRPPAPRARRNVRDRLR